MLPGCVLPQGVREQGDIESNSLMIAPETMDIRCLLPTDKPGKDHIEVTAGDGDMEQFCGEAPCRFFLARPSMDVSPALWWVVTPTETEADANMTEVFHIYSTCASGCSLIGPPLSQGGVRGLVARVEAIDHAMRWRIPILVNTKVIKKGELLTRYVKRSEAPAGSKDVAPIRASQLLNTSKKQKLNHA